MGRWTSWAAHRFGANKNQGSNWIHRPTRLAIYARDRFRCAYCQRGPYDGVVLTLDHLLSREQGGSHEPTNLVTACFSCNSARRDSYPSAWRAWLVELGTTPREVAGRIRNAVRRKLNRPLGRVLAAAEDAGATASELADRAQAASPVRSRVTAPQAAPPAVPEEDPWGDAPADAAE